MRTVQEAFDVAAVHMLRQMEYSEMNGQCAYRGRDDLRCAVGALITDAAYTDELEECFEPQSIPVCNALADSGWPTDGSSLGVYEQLQDIHDGYNIEKWFDELMELATEHGFDTSVLKEFKP
jgi:hypothetical protein